jgi:tetratricopeptide (TPR) repeat protein
LHEEALAILRELGDQSGIAVSLNCLGNVALDQGDSPVARALYEESLVIRRQLGDRWGVASSLNNLGNVAHDQGDYLAARALYEQSLAIARELGDQWRVARSLSDLGIVAHDQGDYGVAGALHQEVLVIRRDLGDRLGIAISLEGLAAVFAGLGSSLRAARIWGAAERQRAVVGSPLWPRDRPDYNRNVAVARAADDAAFDDAWREGGALTLEQAIDLALDQTVEQHDE